MIDQQKKELKKYLIAKEAVKILWNGAPSKCSDLEPEEILMVVNAFEEAKARIEGAKEVRYCGPGFNEPNNNQEIGEAETSPNLGGDAAIERCPTEGFD